MNFTITHLSGYCTIENHDCNIISWSDRIDIYLGNSFHDAGSFIELLEMINENIL